MSAVEKARAAGEAYWTCNCASIGPFCRKCERTLKGTMANTFPAALDFADAVEKGLTAPPLQDAQRRLRSIEHALAAFTAELERALPGGGE